MKNRKRKKKSLPTNQVVFLVVPIQNKIPKSSLLKKLSLGEYDKPMPVMHFECGTNRKSTTRDELTSLLLFGVARITLCKSRNSGCKHALGAMKNLARCCVLSRKTVCVSHSECTMFRTQQSNGTKQRV